MAKAIRKVCEPVTGMLLEGWVTAEPGVSETGRKVRFYTLTRAGLKQLKREISDFELATAAIQAILRTA